MPIGQRRRAAIEVTIFFIAVYAIVWIVMGTFMLSGGAPTIFGKPGLPNWWIALCVCAPSVSCWS